MKSYRAVSTISVGCVLLCLVAAILIPVPYVNLSPGPMYNTIGESQGTQLIQISGRQTYPTSGQLDLTTVNERGGPYGALTLPEAMFGWLNPDYVVVPVAYLFPPGITAQEVEQEDMVEFTGSQSAAVGAALGYLKIPTVQRVTVASVTPNSPAAGQLQVGDVITAVDGKPVKQPQEVPTLVRVHTPGKTAVFGILRNDKAIDVPVVLGRLPTDQSKAYAGITAGALIEPPFGIKFGLNDVGGPSAGLMFSLGIIDKLTPGDMTNGKNIGGTGTINPDGNVGSIGGISQKLASARNHGTELFFAPAGNCADIRTVGDKGVNVVKVSTLNEAVDVLARWNAGSTDLPRCS